MKYKIAMFKNEQKKSDNHPDYSGFDNETGNSIAGWITKSKGGKTYMSVVFETGKQGNHSRNQPPSHSQPAPASQPQGMDNQFDDDIPF